jgi:organic radical activating enzyme
MHWAVDAMGKAVRGYSPALSIEITRECPLQCPGCYAYGEDHLGGEVTLRQVSDFQGAALIEKVLALIRQHKPIHVSLVGGEPLVRHRELNELLPQMAAMGIHTQLVTSAVRPIPLEWASIPRLSISVSVDGLAPEHDARRKPATYERILKHIAGHQVTVHCTITRQQVKREGYLEEFIRFWSGQLAARRIWISLYTPQIGEVSEELLTSVERRQVIASLQSLRLQYPKLDMASSLIEAYAHPPQSPKECAFAKATHCVSADLQTKIVPCQFGGQPDCSQCGCMASAGLTAVARHKLLVGLDLGTIFDASLRVGAFVRALRKASRNGAPSVCASALDSE